MCSVLVTAPVIFWRFTNITDIKKKNNNNNKTKQNKTAAL